MDEINLIVIDEGQKENGELGWVRVGFYDDDDYFFGCEWNNYECCNEWYIKNRSLWNDCEGDEDTMRDVFSKKFGEQIARKIDDLFNKDYYLEDGIIYDKYKMLDLDEDTKDEYNRNNKK